MARNWYTVKAAQSGKPAEISIFDEIGFWGVTAKDFKRDFDALEGDTVTLLINSPGGVVVDALTICNTILHSGKTVNGKVMGIAASAASVIAMACTSLEMPENTFMFLHDPLDGGYGDAEDHREIADLLDKLALSLVSMYAKKSGQTVEKIKELLSADSLLTAEECKALGLCDTVSPAVAAVARYETDRLPDRVKAMFASSDPVACDSTPFALRVKALADGQGLGEFAAVWAASDLSIEAVTAAIAEAAEIKALCQVVGLPDLVSGLVRAQTTLPNARAAVQTALAAADAATAVDTARKTTESNRSSPPVMDSQDIWAQYRALQEKKS